jgi:hypothetical protein
MFEWIKELFSSLNEEYPCVFLKECRRVPFTHEEVMNVARQTATPVVCPFCKEKVAQAAGDIRNVFGIYYDKSGAILLQHACGEEFILSGDGSLLSL